MRKLLTTVLSSRTVASVLTGLEASPWVLAFRQYVFDDWNFVGYLFVLILVDTILALQHHWGKCSISSRGFSRLFTKAGLYLALLVLSHVMANFQIHGEKNLLFAWFTSFIYSAMMAREALSILEHVAAIDARFVPAWLLRRLALFNAQGPDGAGDPPATIPPAEGIVP